MNKRERWRRRKEKRQATDSAPTPNTPPADSGPEPSWFSGPGAWFLSAVVIFVALYGGYRFFTSFDDTSTQIAQNDPKRGPEDDEPPVPKKPPAKAPDKGNDDFLSEFNKIDDSPAKASGESLGNSDLEKRLYALVDVNDQLADLKKRARGPDADDAEFTRTLKRTIEQYDRLAAALEKDLAAAKRALPDDPIPRWLTGELLTIVGAEPEEIESHLQFALKRGLKRPRLLGTLAHTQFEANAFAESLRTATAALDQSGHDHYLWNVYAQTAIGNHQFEALNERLENAFSTGLPSWAKTYKQQADALGGKWQAEQQFRRAEERADDLPRVRLMIAHRRFARDASGKPLTTIETVGKGEIILELFENEAPGTVANFIDLVSQKFYDGTTFHLVLPAAMVTGGDPNTKNDDPADDGQGGPGYAIADENKGRNARNHFRGSVSMAKTVPNSAGSQFFFSLVPLPEVDGHYTVFGRIIKGQDVADRITRGRTTRELGHFGPIIPGDLLVSAEVLRKRPHEYKALQYRP